MVFKKEIAQKQFLHICYFENVFYVETVYIFASKLLLLFPSKHPKKTVTVTGLFFNEQVKKFLIKKVYLDIYISYYCFQGNTIKSWKV